MAIPDPPPPLIGALLRMPLDAVHRVMIEALHARGFTDVTPAHLPVLRWPGPDGRRPVELAAQVGMTKQAMNYLLGQLETLGYLERRVDPDDVRSRRVHLTGRGRDIPGVIRGAIGELERDWESRMGSGDWRRLKELLLELNTAAAERP
ncbi:MAG: MarR family winged helix-turn-helix transcriptional regulator [Chloroflexota bacterium]